MSNMPERVYYQPHQILRTRDFQDEQSYHLSMRWRHHLGLHPWGNVHGLVLLREEGQVRVGPGLAIDGYARELLLTAATPVPDLDFRLEPGPLYVWLEYRQTEVGQEKCRVVAGSLQEQPAVTTSRKAIR